MKKTISKEQYDELRLLACIDDNGYHAKLAENNKIISDYRQKSMR